MGPHSWSTNPLSTPTQRLLSEPSNCDLRLADSKSIEDNKLFEDYQENNLIEKDLDGRKDLMTDDRQRTEEYQKV